MPQTVWIARHGNRIDFVNPDWFLTAERRYDPHLSDDGIIQAQELAQRLRSEPIDRILVSPFFRAIQTAHEIAQVLTLPLHIEPGLSEWLNPEWMTAMPETRTMDELTAQFPEIDPTYTPCLLPTFPETQDQLIERAGEAARRIVARFPAENLLLVGHGASVVGASWGLLSDRPKIHASLCCLVQLERQDAPWQLIHDGSDVSHLTHPQTQVRLV
jgi:broad specificity phosphatase PhoE